jgi:hypothetical protein
MKIERSMFDFHGILRTWSSGRDGSPRSTPR